LLKIFGQQPSNPELLFNHQHLAELLGLHGLQAVVTILTTQLNHFELLTPKITYTAYFAGMVIGTTAGMYY
jgi:hypothetical protein